MAQNELPMFRYQAVLRDANNELVKNQSGTVVFSIGNVEWEPMEFTTNENGLVSLELEPMNDVSWAGAVINAEFTFEDQQTISLSTPVTVVPFALQAGDAKITTPMLVDYFGSPRNGSDVDAVYQALKENPTFSQACRDSAVNYIKANYPIAKEIAYNYLSKVSTQDVKDAYDSMRIVDVAVKQAFYDIIKDYLKNHRSLLLEVAEYYITSATVAEAEELYASFENSTAAPEVRRILLQYFEQYLRSHNLICDNSQNWTLCSAASYVATNTVCPRFTDNSVKGYRYGTLQGQDLATVERVLYQVYVDNMGVVDLSSVTVKVKFIKGQDEVVMDMQRSGNSNLFSLELGPNDGIADINANVGFDVQLFKSGCPDVQEHGSYTNVPNN